MNRTLARFVLISAGLIWGLGFIGNKIVLDSGWNDSQLLFFRFITATVLIFIVFWKRIIKTNKYVIKQGLFLGVFLYLGFYFQTWGLELTTPSNNALVTSGYIVMLPIIVFIFDRVKVPLTTIIAGIVTMAGISIITVNFSELEIAFGDVLTFIGAFFYGIHIFLLGKRSKQVDLYVLMSFQLLMFSFLTTFMLFMDEGLPDISFSSFDGYKIMLLAMVLGVFASFAGFIFQSIGQKHTNASEAAILISTESVFGPMFAIMFYNDPFSIKIVIGIFLVFCGVVLSEIDFIGAIKKMKKKSV